LWQNPIFPCNLLPKKKKKIKKERGQASRSTVAHGKRGGFRVPFLFSKEIRNRKEKSVDGLSILLLPWIPEIKGGGEKREKKRS